MGLCRDLRDGPQTVSDVPPATSPLQPDTLCILRCRAWAAVW